MSFTQTMKTTAAAIAMIGASSAFAANLPVNLATGTGVLTVSSTAQTNLGFGGITFGALSGSTTSQSGSVLTQAETAAIASADNSALASVSFLGSGWVLKNSSLTITYSNIAADLTGKTIYADVTDSLGTSNVALFNVATVAGSTAIPAGLTNGQTASFSNTLTGLTLTTTAATRIGTVANAANLVGFLQSIDFGTFAVNTTVTAVPEPSTYAMVGLGLVAVGAMARRRKQA